MPTSDSAYMTIKIRIKFEDGSPKRRAVEWIKMLHSEAKGSCFKLHCAGRDTQSCFKAPRDLQVEFNF